MDLPAPVEQPGTESGSDPADTDAPPPAAAAPTATRSVSPGDVQAELAELSRRVDALAASLDTSVRTAVAEEVQRVAGELQHTVAALGRVLVRDLGRLNQILTQHRDTILAELHGRQVSGGTTGPPEAPAEAAADSPASSPPSASESAAAVEQAAETGGSPPENEKGRNWRRRKA